MKDNIDETKKKSNDLQDEKNTSDKCNNKINKKIWIIIIVICIFIIIGIIAYSKIVEDNCTNNYTSNNSYTSNNNYTSNNSYTSNNNHTGHSIVVDEIIKKPIIYLYPTEDMEVSVQLGYSNKITVSYPDYVTGWNVLAKTDGSLIDLETNRNLYSLYYESTAVVDFKVEKDGFVVKGEEVAEFLEEKLAILGLTERESEEFIIYWLPKLQENEYNYIRFATNEEINKNMPLDIEPNPDTIIRVLMTYKGLDEPIEVEEQEIVTPKRIGFVAVEWGGTEIDK